MARSSIRKSPGERFFDAANVLAMLVIMAITLYPFLHILAVSLNEALDSAAGGIGVWPRKFSIDSYETVFRYHGISAAFLVSVVRTALGTFGGLLLTSIVAYAMTKKELIGYRFAYRFFVISMFINGGLIPTFFLYQKLGLYNTFWVYILPGLFGMYHMILMRTFIQQLPGELEESALLDGAHEFTIFFRIILPLSTPILATIGLFIAVTQWNAWQDTLFYTTNPDLETLQYVLMKVLRQSEANSMARKMRQSMSQVRAFSITPESVKMAITIVSTLPILCVYPFIQKYFVKGMMVGAVKG